MENYQSDFRMDQNNQQMTDAANTRFSLGTCSLSELRKLEPANPRIDAGALNAVNLEFNAASSIQTSWAHFTDAKSGVRAEISKSYIDTSVEFDKSSNSQNKRVSRYSDGTISVSHHRPDLVIDRYSLYNTAGMMTFNSFNTNDQTRIDEFFDAQGKLSQTTLLHVDSELKVNQEIIFTGPEKKLKSMTDRYWDGRTDVFTADEQGKLRLQKK